MKCGKWTLAVPLCLLAFAAQTLAAQSSTDHEQVTGSGDLVAAVEAGDLEAVKRIARADNVNIREESPLHPGEPGKDVEWDEGFGGRTPLIIATEQGSTEIVKALVECGARIGDTYTYSPASCSEWSATALEIAVIWGHAEIVSYLLSKGAPATDDMMLDAARNGHLGVVQALVENGASIHVTRPETPWSGSGDMDFEWVEWSGDGMSAAIESGHPEIADYLWRKGARPSAYAVTAAIRAGDLALAKTYLAAGAGVSAGALVAAVRNGDPDLTSTIVNAGAGVNEIDTQGSTPLAAAAEAGNLAAVRLLISRGALIHKEDGFGMIPLERIDDESGGDWDLIKRLLDR